MNTKSGIFTRGFATRENTAFDVHSLKEKSILHRKKSYILYIVSLVLNVSSPGHFIRHSRAASCNFAVQVASGLILNASEIL